MLRRIWDFLTEQPSRVLSYIRPTGEAPAAPRPAASLTKRQLAYQERVCLARRFRVASEADELSLAQFGRLVHLTARQVYLVESGQLGLSLGQRRDVERALAAMKRAPVTT